MAADLWQLEHPELIRRGMNALYGCGDVVLRVGHSTAAAHLGHDLAKVMGARGVPTVMPVDGLAGEFEGVSITAWQRVPATDTPIDWTVIGAAVRTVHDVDAAMIPDGYPVPSPVNFPWWNFATMLSKVADHLDAAARRGLESAIERSAGWQEAIASDVVICHGDVHPGNVLTATAGPKLIDWDLLCTTNPAWDHAMLTTYAERWGGSPEVYPAFAEGYGADLGNDALAMSLAELRNVAATLMRVQASLTDPTARGEADRRLRFWRGDRNAPTWTAQ